MPERFLRTGVGVDEFTVLGSERQHRDGQEPTETHSDDYRIRTRVIFALRQARRRRSALATTDTELSDIASAATSGDSRIPKKG